MGTRALWIGAALLSASLVAGVGCNGNGDQPDDAPPPEMTTDGMGDATTDAMDTAGDSMDSGMDTAGDSMDSGMDTAGDSMDSGMDTAGDAMAGATDGMLELRAVAGEGGQVEVHAGGQMVGTMQPGGAVSDELANWLKSQADMGTDGQVSILVPVQLKFDDVGMPLMKAVFAAGFPPTQVSYKPVTQ